MSIVFWVMVWYVRREVAHASCSGGSPSTTWQLLHQQRTAGPGRLARAAYAVDDRSGPRRTGPAHHVRRRARRRLDVVIDELKHLKHISDRLLALAAMDQPDFLHSVRSRVDDLVIQVWSRWSTTHREIQLGSLVALEVPHDDMQVREALDELITNAVRHCPPGTPVTVAMSVGRRRRTHRCRGSWPWRARRPDGSGSSSGSPRAIPRDPTAVWALAWRSCEPSRTPTGER